MNSPTNKKTKLIQLLVEKNIIKFGEFTLKSGAKSWFYIDLRLIPSFPKVFKHVIDCYQDTIIDIGDYDAVAGVAVAGVPFSAVLGYTMHIPALIVRPEAKGHGLKKLVEGSIHDQAKVILVDDLITTGGSKVPGIEALREMNLIVDDIVVLIDRSEGNTSDLTDLGVKIHSTVTIAEIWSICLKLPDDVISQDIKQLIKENCE